MGKRTLREQLQYSLLWSLFILVSCLCAVLIDLLFVRILATFIEVSYMTEALIHVIFLALGAAVPLAAIAYLISYHLGAFSGADSALEGGIALLPQLGLAILFGFPKWISGGVKWLAALFEYGSSLHYSDQLSDISLTNFLIAFVIFGAFYLVVKYVAGVLGRDARIRHRIELTGSPVKPSERDSVDSAE